MMSGLDYSVILVTGGAGFIGSHLVDRLMDEGFIVRVVDNLFTGDKANLVQHQDKKDFQFIDGDIRNFDLLKKVVKGVDAVFHEAAVVSVIRSVENPTLSNEVNVAGTVNLLKACVVAHVKKFIYASSSSIYGDTMILPKHENLVPKPLSPYAVSKLAAENYVKVFNKVYDLETVSLRYFNVYGPRQKYGPYSGVISIFINRLLENKPPIIYGNGEQTRDFTYVKDVVDVNMLALTNQKAIGEVFNTGTGETTTVNKLAETLKDLMSKTDLESVYTKSRSGDIEHSYADITKARKILEYNPKVKLENGLRSFIKWFHEN
jgi:nucleoside-diphosphate-sugar epimerase